MPLDLRSRFFDDDKRPRSEILDRIRLGAPQIGDVEAQALPTARSTMMSPSEFARAAPLAADPRGAARGIFSEGVPSFDRPTPPSGGSTSIVDRLLGGPPIPSGAPSALNPMATVPSAAPTTGMGSQNILEALLEMAAQGGFGGDPGVRIGVIGERPSDFEDESGSFFA